MGKNAIPVKLAVIFTHHITAEGKENSIQAEESYGKDIQKQAAYGPNLAPKFFVREKREKSCHYYHEVQFNGTRI